MGFIKNAFFGTLGVLALDFMVRAEYGGLPELVYQYIPATRDYWENLYLVKSQSEPEATWLLNTIESIPPYLAFCFGAFKMVNRMERGKGR